MEDNWEVYFCKVDDTPACIRINLGLAPLAPVQTLPFFAYVTITINNPDPNGFVSPEEFEHITTLENTLVTALTQNGAATFAGCCTADGNRDFIFFVQSNENWDEKVDAALAQFIDYSYETSIYEDPAWNGYFEFLYPSDEDMQIIENRKQLEEMQQEGDNLDAPRMIDHCFNVYSQDDVEALVAKTAALGFAVESVLQPQDGTATDDAGATLVTVRRVNTPNEMNTVTLTLVELAADCDADYIGWGGPLAE